MAKKRCLNCKKGMKRVRRRPWMRLIPFSKKYYCAQCDSRYLTIFKVAIIVKKINKYSLVFGRL